MICVSVLRPKRGNKYIGLIIFGEFNVQETIRYILDDKSDLLSNEIM